MNQPEPEPINKDQELNRLMKMYKKIESPKTFYIHNCISQFNTLFGYIITNDQLQSDFIKDTLTTRRRDKDMYHYIYTNYEECFQLPNEHTIFKPLKLYIDFIYLYLKQLRPKQKQLTRKRKSNLLYDYLFPPQFINNLLISTKNENAQDVNINSESDKEKLNYYTYLQHHPEIHDENTLIYAKIVSSILELCIYQKYMINIKKYINEKNKIFKEFLGEIISEDIKCDEGDEKELKKKFDDLN